MLHYITTACTLENPDLGSYQTHGILAMEDETAIAELTDISVNPAAVEKLAELLNKEKVSVLHFQEVVEDFVAEQ